MSHQAASAQLHDDVYNRKALLERRNPSHADWDYFILTDIAHFVEQQGALTQGMLIDFGCGRSPYRSFFPQCDYHRADLAGSKDIDYTVASSGAVNAPNGQFDVVLSTQVAEHVRDPALYLSESFRLLKPGGKLILTTHGMWEDHAVPEDFQRWTADGLKRDVEKAGFTKVEVQRLTTDSRALCQMVSHHVSMQLEGSGLLRGICRKLWRSSRPLVHLLADRLTHHSEIVAAPSRLYIGLAVTARK